MKKLLLAFATTLTLLGSAYSASASAVFYVTFGEWKTIGHTVVINDTPNCFWYRAVYVNGRFAGTQKSFTKGEVNTLTCPAPQVKPAV